MPLASCKELQHRIEEKLIFDDELAKRLAAVEDKLGQDIDHLERTSAKGSQEATTPNAKSHMTGNSSMPDNSSGCLREFETPLVESRVYNRT